MKKFFQLLFKQKIQNYFLLIGDLFRSKCNRLLEGGNFIQLLSRVALVTFKEVIDCGKSLHNFKTLKKFQRSNQSLKGLKSISLQSIAKYSVLVVKIGSLRAGFGLLFLKTIHRDIDLFAHTLMYAFFCNQPYCCFGMLRRFYSFHW